MKFFSWIKQISYCNLHEKGNKIYIYLAVFFIYIQKLMKMTLHGVAFELCTAVFLQIILRTLFEILF